MGARNQTTVVLTEKAQKVRDELAPLFGLKNILSAGLVLMGKLSAEEQKYLIAEANGLVAGSKIKSILLVPVNQKHAAAPAAAPAAAHAEEDAIPPATMAYIRKIALTDQGYKTDIKILGPGERQALAELKQILGVEEKTTRAKKA